MVQSIVFLVLLALRGPDGVVDSFNFNHHHSVYQSWNVVYPPEVCTGLEVLARQMPGAGLTAALWWLSDWWPCRTAIARGSSSLTRTFH